MDDDAYYEDEDDPHEDYDETYYDEGADDEPVPEELEQAHDAAEEDCAAYSGARAKMRKLAKSRGLYPAAALIDEQRGQ